MYSFTAVYDKIFEITCLVFQGNLDTRIKHPTIFPKNSFIKISGKTFETKSNRKHQKQKEKYAVILQLLL